jgi:histidine triad (HIT) family protein
MCLFCKIANKEIPATFVYESPTVVAFKDIAPQAPVHIVIVPRAHVASLAEMTDRSIMADVLVAAQTIAREQGLTGGYRIVSNIGTDGGQTVEHMHVHLLGGRALGWPPG